MAIIFAPLQATSSSIWPHCCASPALSNVPVIVLCRPIGVLASCWACWSELVLLFLQRHATTSLLHLSNAHSRLPFISVGVAFVVTPLDELPFASSLMLIQWFCSLTLVLLFLQCHQATNGFLHPFQCLLETFDHLRRCPFCCDPVAERPLASLLTLTHQDDGPRVDLGQSMVQMITNSVDTLISDGCLLSWYIMDTRNWPTELTLSLSILIRGLTFINSNQVPVQDIIPSSSALSRYSRIL